MASCDSRLTCDHRATSSTGSSGSAEDSVEPHHPKVQVAKPLTEILYGGGAFRGVRRCFVTLGRGRGERVIPLRQQFSGLRVRCRKMIVGTMNLEVENTAERVEFGLSGRRCPEIPHGFADIGVQGVIAPVLIGLVHPLDRKGLSRGRTATT